MNRLLSMNKIPDDGFDANGFAAMLQRRFVFVLGLFHPFFPGDCRYIHRTINPLNARNHFTSENCSCGDEVWSWLNDVKVIYDIHGAVRPAIRVLDVVPHDDSLDIQREWITEAELSGCHLLNKYKTGGSNKNNSKTIIDVRVKFNDCKNKLDRLIADRI